LIRGGWRGKRRRKGFGVGGRHRMEEGREKGGGKRREGGRSREGLGGKRNDYLVAT